MQYSQKRKAAIEALGGKCVQCGFRDRRALQIDHVYGNGAEERREYGPRTLEIIYQKIVVGGDVWSYQLLCANCNWIKRAEKHEARVSGSHYSKMKHAAKKRGLLKDDRFLTAKRPSYTELGGLSIALDAGEQKSESKLGSVCVTKRPTDRAN